MLDVDTGGTVRDIADRLVHAEADETSVREVDEIAPATVKGAMYEVAAVRGSPGVRVDVPLQDFLRDTIKVAFGKGELKGRINVGANRYFSRLLQYVRGMRGREGVVRRDRGMRLRNAGGRGRVADSPAHLVMLKLVVGLDNL